MFPMIMQDDKQQQLKNSSVKKLRKFVLAGAASLVLNGCVSIDQIDRSMLLKEVPHVAETTLDGQFVKKQARIDDDFLSQEDAMLQEICFSELFTLPMATNRAEQSDMALQKLDEYCQTMKVLAQSAAGRYKQMEDATKKKYKISGYEVLSVINDICSYHTSETIKSARNGVRISNQGLPEDTDINVVRAALQHRMHMFLDAKNLALMGASAHEVTAMEKYELGYGFLDDHRFTSDNQQDIEEQIYHSVQSAIEDIIDYAMYEYRHGAQVQNPHHIEVELQNLFDQLEKGLNAYGYQGQGGDKDMQMANQAMTQIAEMLPQSMFGSPRDIKTLLGEVSSSLSFLPLTRSLRKQGVDLSQFHAGVTAQQTTTNEKVR